MPDPEHPEQPGRTVPTPVTSYDLSSGAGDELCALPFVLDNPQVAAHNGTLLIYSNGMSTTALAPAVVRVRDGQATELEGALPAFVADSEKLTYVIFTEKMNIPLRGVLAPTSDGFVLVGPPAADGSSDTYVLRDDSDKFEPYGKRLSEDCAYSQAACTYRGQLFAIGSALLEPNNRIFRTTAMEVPEYPGDIPCDPEPTKTFPDVPEDAWFHDVVYRSTELGLFNGYDGGNFGPDDKTTRGQAAVVLWNMAGHPTAGEGAKTFPDVRADMYYADAIAWASSVGVASGYKDDRFGPDDPVAREQLAAMLSNYARNVAKRDTPGSAADYSAMKDAAKVSEWAENSVGWCFRSKIMSGTEDGYVNPQGNATRAEAAKMAVCLHDMP